MWAFVSPESTKWPESQPTMNMLDNGNGSIFSGFPTHPHFSQPKTFYMDRTCLVGLCFTQIHQVVMKLAHSQVGTVRKWVHFQGFSNPCTFSATTNLRPGQGRAGKYSPKRSCRTLFHPNPPCGHEVRPLQRWYMKKLSPFSVFFKPRHIFCNHKHWTWAGQACTPQSDPAGLCFTQF